jgi:hypothetical protein
MKIPTRDRTVFIIEQEPGRVVYETILGEKWEILGTCNQCGLCEVGSSDPQIFWVEGKQPGEPGACYNILGEERLDNPCRPEIKQNFPECTLSGNYLNGN